MVPNARRILTLMSTLALAASSLALATPAAEAVPCEGPATSVSAMRRIGLHADAQCRKFFVDALPGAHADAKMEPSGNRDSGAQPADAFNLHTRPGSENILYLDFDGHTWAAGTWWDGYYAGSVGALEGRVSTGYDRDGDPTTFTDEERREIIDIWESVAEDFAVFDVDVTTEQPTGDRADLFAAKGSWALILTDQGLQNGCGCGGVAYLDVIANGSPYTRPALNFMDFGGWRTSAWDVAEIVAHEVGHNFGLYHDGTSAIEYYGGQSMWTPIMGAGRGAGIATWSAGGYPDSQTRGAQAFEDDFAAIARYAPLLPDAVGNSSGAASDLGVVRGAKEVQGLINSATDVDWFKFTVPAGADGQWEVNLDSYGYAPNLDPELKLYSATPSLLQKSNPLVPIGPIGGVITEGLEASISRSLTAGTYYVSIDGVGQGLLSDGSGYSDYASVGRYTLSVVSPVGAPPVITSLSKSSGGPGTAVVINGSNLDGVASVAFGSVAATRFTTIDSDRIIVGVPAGAGLGYVKVFDSGGIAYQSPQQFDGRGAAVAPAVTSLGASAAGVDEWVVVNGSNVGAATSVTLAGAQVAFIPSGADTLSFKTASGLRGGAVAVATAGGSASAPTVLRLLAAPIVDSVSVSSGYPGETIELVGANLLETSSVVVNGVLVAVSIESDNRLTVLVPEGSETGVIEVENAWGKWTSSEPFTILPRTPSVDDVSAVQGLPGAKVTLTGRWLETTKEVEIAGRPAAYTVASDSSLTFTVPTGAVSGRITLTTAYGSWESDFDFAVLAPKPSIAKFTPGKAKAGAVVVIYGKNFNGALSVWFGGVKALKVQRLSATKLKVTVPPKAKTGVVQVRAIGGTAKSPAKFTVLR